MRIKFFFGKLKEKIKKIFHFIGIAQNVVLLTLVYFLVVGLISLLTKLAKKDFLNVKIKEAGTFWKDALPLSDNLDDYLRQF